MWAALNDIAAERGKTVHDVILEINRDRKGISLTAAIRVYIVEYYREALRGCRTEKAPPSPAGPGDLKGDRLAETLTLPRSVAAVTAATKRTGVGP